MGEEQNKIFRIEKKKVLKFISFVYNGMLLRFIISIHFKDKQCFCKLMLQSFSFSPVRFCDGEKIINSFALGITVCR